MLVRLTQHLFIIFLEVGMSFSAWRELIYTHFDTPPPFLLLESDYFSPPRAYMMQHYFMSRAAGTADPPTP